MNVRKLSLALGLPAVLAIGAATVAPRQDGGEALLTSQIGVVDLEELLRSYPGAARVQAEFKKLELGMNAEMEALQQAITELEVERSSFEEGTDEFGAANFRFQLKRLEAEKTREMFERKLQFRQVEIRLELYDELALGVDAYAKAKKLKLVLRWRGVKSSDPAVRKLEQYELRDVLYREGAVDITKDVINFMKNWKPGGAAPK